MINRARNGAFDELYTPAEAVSYLLPYLPDGIIWESAPGTGQLIKFLQQAKRKVVWGNKDYFEWQPEMWDIQVTNPPFSIKAKWLKRANELEKPYAILLPVGAIGARNVQEQLFDTRLLLLPHRIDFTGKKAPWFAVAWYTRGLNLPLPLTIANDL